MDIGLTNFSFWRIPSAPGYAGLRFASVLRTKPLLSLAQMLRNLSTRNYKSRNGYGWVNFLFSPTMFKTEHGDFTGDSWEGFCRLCFKLKYEEEGYQDMPANPGDYGIEGFTRTGKVFQCYCPNVEYEPDKLYNEQRDKITTDLRKLERYEKELKGYLKDIKIKQWILVTPGFSKHQLVKHCRDKADELKAKNLGILDGEFDVLVHDIGFFTAQIPVVRGYQKQPISIIPQTTSSEDDVTNWKERQIPLVENAVRKHTMRFPSNVKELDMKVNHLTHKSVKEMLDGGIIVRKWKENFPEDYERFERIKSQVEEEVKERCLFPTTDNNKRYHEFELMLESRLQLSFTYLDSVTIKSLTKFIMSDWIFRCPINFEE